MLGILGLFCISLAVLGLSLGLAMLLVYMRIISSEFIGQCILFGPLLFFWIAGVWTGQSPLSDLSCFKDYTELPNGLLLDSFGNETTRFSMTVECGTSLLGAVFFEMIAGAWFVTIPRGVMAVFQSIFG